MTSDAVLVVKCLFQVIWQFFSTWTIPGTNVTPAVMGLFLVSASVGINLVTKFLAGGVSGGASAYTRASISNAKLHPRPRLPSGK